MGSQDEDTHDQSHGAPPRYACVADELHAANDHDGARRNGLPLAGRLPSREAVVELIADLRAAMFPRHFGSDDAVRDVRHVIEKRVRRAARNLREQVKRGLLSGCVHSLGWSTCAECGARSEAISDALILSLPRLRAKLEADVRATYEADPAAASPDEVLFCYPGVAALIQHRIAHELYQSRVPLLPRFISELAHSATGIDIHPGAEIGSSFVIDHGTGVVIGQTCSIGERVRIYQGVTLGARSASAQRDEASMTAPRHPLVEDDVTIYAGATILGRIRIGRGATIGGNVWLMRSVQAGERVTQAQIPIEALEEASGL